MSDSAICSSAADKRQHRLQAARDATAVTRAQISDAERSLIFNVGQQFITGLLAESTLQFAQEDLADFQQTVNISQEQFKAGYIGEADFLKIKLQLLQFQTDVSSARLAKVQALTALRELLGYDAVPANFDIVGELAYQPVNTKLDDLQAEALRQRPDYRAAELGISGGEKPDRSGQGEFQSGCDRHLQFQPRRGRTARHRYSPMFRCPCSTATRARSHAPAMLLPKPRSRSAPLAIRFSPMFPTPTKRCDPMTKSCSSTLPDTCSRPRIRARSASMLTSAEQPACWITSTQRAATGLRNWRTGKRWLLI